MANREALRELQKRLASRLQAARTEGVTVSWLAVKAGGENYLFPLAQAGEIFPLVSLQSVPYSCNWFLGVINLRGGLYGVVDMAGLIHPERVRVRSEQLLSEASVVTFSANAEINCALQVDTLAGLRNPDSFVNSEVAAIDSPVFFGKRMRDPNGETWQEINLRTLSQTAEFLNISA